MRLRLFQTGVTLIEATGAMLIAALMLAGLSAMISSALDDSKGQQASLYQSQVVDAAKKYISEANNFNTLTSTAAVKQITLSDLKNGRLLPDSFTTTNVYGQQTCILVKPTLLPPPQSSKLDVLIVTTRNAANTSLEIPAKDIAAVAANAGIGNGFFDTETNGARGSSWSLDRDGLVAFTGTMVAPTMCPNMVPPTAGHLISALFFDGAGQLATDFLYRDKVDGRRYLNQMNTPLFLPGTAIANTSEAKICDSDPTTFGGISSDSSGNVLSCVKGVWRNQNKSWREPIDSYANLTLLPAADNNPGDVRVVTSLNRAFIWDGVTDSWVGLGADQDGNLTLQGTLTANNIVANDSITATNAITANILNLNLNQATTGAPCTRDGAVASDANGQILSCVLGSWRGSNSNSVGPMVAILPTPPMDTTVGGTGTTQFDINIGSIPGKRPLYLTGALICISESAARAFIKVTIHDAYGVTLGWAGSCASASHFANSRNEVKTAITLHKLPDNASFIRVQRESGAAVNDYTHTELEFHESL